MNIDEFWKLIDDSDSREERQQIRAAHLQEELKRRPHSEIIDFHAHFLALRQKVNTYRTWGAFGHLFGSPSTDSFLDFQAWLVGLGKESFDLASSDADSLCDVPQVREWVVRLMNPAFEADPSIGYFPGFELLAYVARRAYREKANGEATGFDNALSERGLEQMQEPADEYWDIQDGDEIAGRLPRTVAFLRSLF
ncbi:DUF4240 domain-containing protein [Nonomuraea endophytica]|uniref:DUF4240 domain-containing protein n=1 Tax=Nonomuraea endophytica TaxID=714136 RepID=A0A7W8ADA3_9ACTN|nr:DUF4240 domain-containing protein [Nonomuraea endophytica]MBB5083584.1 hypothetical protein [Nonomuraea endophytica]